MVLVDNILGLAPWYYS